jgi:putative ABC transport system permease protein
VTSRTVIWHNLWRNKVRTGLTIVSVAVSLFLFTMLRAVVVSMQSVADRSASQLRLVVQQKTTMTKLLPLGHGPKIAAVPGVQAVCAVRWFGGRVPNGNAQFPSLAAQPETFPAVYADFELREAELDAWRAERTAAIVGAGLAQRMGWTRGQRVTLRAGIPPYPLLEFHIVGVTAAPPYPNLFVLRLDYLLDALKVGPALPPYYYDGVNFFWAKTATPAALEAARGAIDALFAQSPDATRTELEESFVAQFTKMFGDIPRMLNSTGLVVVASILLVVGNTMSMTIRERTRELAVLKAVGFSSARLLWLVLGESTLLALSGALLGCVPALIAFGGSPTAGLSMPYFPLVSVSPAVLGLGVGVGVLVGMLAGLVPLWRVARLSATTALREEA